jgi:hypothetical protein
MSRIQSTAEADATSPLDFSVEELDENQMKAVVGARGPVAGWGACDAFEGPVGGW